MCCSCAFVLAVDVFCSVLDKSIWAYSGHYKPSAENLSNFMNFLEENGIDLKEVEVHYFHHSQAKICSSHQIADDFI
jgi:hypothetical protein